MSAGDWRVSRGLLLYKDDSVIRRPLTNTWKPSCSSADSRSVQRHDEDFLVVDHASQHFYRKTILGREGNLLGSITLAWIGFCPLRFDIGARRELLPCQQGFMRRMGSKASRDAEYRGTITELASQTACKRRRSRNTHKSALPSDDGEHCFWMLVELTQPGHNVYHQITTERVQRLGPIELNGADLA